MIAIMLSSTIVGAALHSPYLRLNPSSQVRWTDDLSDATGRILEKPGHTRRELKMQATNISPSTFDHTRFYNNTYDNRLTLPCTVPGPGGEMSWHLYGRFSEQGDPHEQVDEYDTHNGPHREDSLGGAGQRSDDFQGTSGAYIGNPVSYADVSTVTIDIMNSYSGVQEVRWEWNQQPSDPDYLGYQHREQLGRVTGPDTAPNQYPTASSSDPFQLQLPIAFEEEGHYYLHVASQNGANNWLQRTYGPVIVSEGIPTPGGYT